MTKTMTKTMTKMMTRMMTITAVLASVAVLLAPLPAGAEECLPGEGDTIRMVDQNGARRVRATFTPEGPDLVRATFRDVNGAGPTQILFRGLVPLPGDDAPDARFDPPLESFFPLTAEKIGQFTLDLGGGETEQLVLSVVETGEVVYGDCTYQSVRVDLINPEATAGRSVIRVTYLPELRVWAEVWMIDPSGEEIPREVFGFENAIIDRGAE